LLQYGVPSSTTALAALGVWGGVTAASVGAAALVDVADGAPSLGLSTAWIGALGAGLGFAMADLQPTDFDAQQARDRAIWSVLGGAAGAGFIVGVVVGDALDVARPAVWLVDVGAGAGALAGLGLALAVGAGSPALGWGAALGGAALGTAGGLWAAVAATEAWRAAPTTAAALEPPLRLGPMVLAPVGAGSVAPGLALSARLP
jgi:hypothetical protein